MPRTAPTTIKEAGLDHSRDRFNIYYGKKIRVEQWRILLTVCEERNLIPEDTGVIPDASLKQLAMIKKNCGAFKDTYAVFNYYFEIVNDLKIKGLIYGFQVKKDVANICLKYCGFTPQESTVYGWFGRASLSFKASNTYTVEQITPVYIRAMFAKQPKKSALK